MNFSLLSSGRLKYPLATPMPPIIISPTAKKGENCRDSFST